MSKVCKDCKLEKCKGVNCPSVDNISISGGMGVYSESVHSSEIGPGKKYIDVTEKVLNRYNPYFTRRS